MIMKGFIEFIGAALPWIAIGLLLAIFSARSADHGKNREKHEDYGTEGLALGMCLGTALAVSMHFNIGLGMMAGMLLGLLAGSRKEKK